MSKSATESSRVKETRAETLSAAVAALQRGDVIVFPTETLYGLGADALDSAAVEKVFRLKDRDPDNPIPVLVSRPRAMLRILVAEVPPLAERLIARFWPGPLTLVLPARSGYAAAAFEFHRRRRRAHFQPTDRHRTRQSPRPSAHRDQRESIRASLRREPSRKQRNTLPAGSISLSTAARSFRKPAPPSSKLSAIQSASYATVRSAGENCKAAPGKAESCHETRRVHSFAARRRMVLRLRL